MATTIVVVANSRTPVSAVLYLHNDGVADVLPLTLAKATLLAQLRPGPLYELINRTPDLTALKTTAVLGGSRIRFNEIAGGLNVAQLPALTTLVCEFVADGLSYSLFTNSGDGPVTADLLVEMRALHSNER